MSSCSLLVIDSTRLGGKNSVFDTIPWRYVHPLPGVDLLEINRRAALSELSVIFNKNKSMNIELKRQ